MALAITGWAAPALAQTASSPLDSLDRRDEMLSWEGIGRLDSPTGFCTATLIAQDLVLTAAHCVSDLTSTTGLVFRAGYHNGRALSERRVTRIAVADAYPGGGDGRLNAEKVQNDVALLQLETPITSAEADPFLVHTQAVSSGRVSVLSYGRGRAATLSRQAQCNITDRYAGGILAFDCDVTFGSSGAPVFLEELGRIRIVSIISGSGDGTAYGMSLPQHVAALTRELRNAGAQPRKSHPK